MNNNRIVVDLNKVQFATYFYRNQYEDYRSLRPKQVTLHNTPIDPKEKQWMTGENLLKLVLKRGAQDHWTECCRLHITANRTLLYTGKKASSIWKEWNRRIFKKQ